MIRINLLPVRAVKKQELGRKQLILFALVIIGAVVGNYSWYKEIKARYDKQYEQLRKAKDELAVLERAIGAVKNYVKDKEVLENKLKVLDTLKKGRMGPVKVMDAMATAIPRNVWLKQMDEKSGLLFLEGSAVSNEDLAEFMKSLANVVWTPEGMGRLVERAGGTTSRVELLPSGQVKDLVPDKVGIFFSDIKLKRSTSRPLPGSPDSKAVDFSLTLHANFAI